MKQFAALLVFVQTANAAACQTNCPAGQVQVPDGSKQCPCACELDATSCASGELWNALGAADACACTMCDAMCEAPQVQEAGTCACMCPSTDECTEDGWMWWETKCMCGPTADADPCDEMYGGMFNDAEGNPCPSMDDGAVAQTAALAAAVVAALLF